VPTAGAPRPGQSRDLWRSHDGRLGSVDCSDKLVAVGETGGVTDDQPSRSFAGQSFTRYGPVQLRDLGVGGESPVLLLVGLSEGDTAAAALLRGVDGRTLREVVLSDQALLPRASYLLTQAQKTAASWAKDSGHVEAAEHLLVAIIDQGSWAVIETLRRAGLNPDVVRGRALRILGLTEDLPRIPIAPPGPAGTRDRPPLAIADLDQRAWAVLRWRQEHLPLDRLDHAWQWWALSMIESRALWRLTRRRGLNEEQSCSIEDHHDREVRRRATQAAPAVIEAWDRQWVPHGDQVVGYRSRPVGQPRDRRTGLRWWCRRHSPNFLAGWPTWFKGRFSDMRLMWFWATTRHRYAGGPRPR
jgi:hypothetical protein